MTVDLNKGPSNQTICVIFGLLILFIVFSAIFSVVAVKHLQQEDAKQATEYGAYCREMGVPVEANPWQSRKLGAHWLRGWMQADIEDDGGSE